MLADEPSSPAPAVAPATLSRLDRLRRVYETIQALSAAEDAYATALENAAVLQVLDADQRAKVDHTINTLETRAEGRRHSAIHVRHQIRLLERAEGR
jgi:hypothetical protein